MAKKVSSFLDVNYGWNLGESGWNEGMDENLVKFSFLFDRNVDGITNSLPQPVSGNSFFLTTENRLYFAVGGVWYSSPVPKWFEFKIKQTGEVYQFNGQSVQKINSPSEIADKLGDVELVVEALGSAAYEDKTSFTLTEDISNKTDSLKGSGLVGHKQRTLRETLEDIKNVKADFGAKANGTDDDTAAFQAAAASPQQIIVPSGSYKLSSDVIGNFVINKGVSYTGVGKVYPKIRGFWTDQAGGADVNRVTDRLFVSEAAVKSTGVKETGSVGTWLVSDMGANYLEREAHVLVVSDVGEYAGVFATRTSDKAKIGNYGDSSVAIAGIVQNDSANSNQIGWASYFEANRVTNRTTFGTEFAIKNKGNNTTANPYVYFGGAVGAWFAGGGDGNYNGLPTNPSDTAILIGKNAASWNKGMVFTKDSITGSDGTNGSSIAIEFAKGHKINWTFSDGTTVGKGAAIVSQVSTFNAGQEIVFGNNGLSIKGSDASGTGVDWAIFGGPIAPSGQQVNGLFFGAQSQGTGYTNIQATGPDANIDVKITPKGAGILRLGYQSQTATTPANFTATSYLQIRLNDGTVFYVAGKLGSPW